MKLLRLMMRARSSCPDCDYTEHALTNFTRLLLKATEHTFGLHGLGNALDAPKTWDNQRLHAALSSSGNSTTVEQLGTKLRQWSASWVEQRLYPEYALSALTAPGASASSTALAARIRTEMEQQWPVAAPALGGFHRVPPGAAIHTPHFVVKVSPTTGGITSLVPKAAAAAAAAVDWGDSSSEKHDLFQFVYRSLNQEHDFTPFRTTYTGDWATFPGTWFTQMPGGCYDKQNLDNSTCASEMGCAKSQDWLPSAVEVFSKANASAGHEIVVSLTLPREAHVVYGAPSKVYVTLQFAAATQAIEVDVRWIGKLPTRLPESSLFMLPLARCTAESSSQGGWSLEKLGSWIEAADVVPNGGAGHLHAVGDGGAKRSCGVKTVHVAAFDSALLSVGRETAFPIPLTPLSHVEASGGLTAVLHDNIWDVNYPMW